MTTGCGSLVTDFLNKPQALPGYQTKQRMYCKLAPVGQASSLDENFNSAVYGSICKTAINVWSGDFTLNKWVHRQKKWKETIQWFSPSVLKSSYSLFLSSADSPAHPQSVGCFTLFLSVEWKKKKTNPLPPVGQRPAVFQGFVYRLLMVKMGCF